jgi:hypothetical protein
MSPAHTTTTSHVDRPFAVWAIKVDNSQLLQSEKTRGTINRLGQSVSKPAKF